MNELANLLFIDDGHRYILDGEELPSVSEICRFISRETYSDIPQWRLDAAAERGTAVHKACEVLDKYSEADVNDDILPYVQAYLKFRKDHAVEWEKIEFSTHNPVEKYAGTIDRYGTIDGLKAIVDFKSSYTIHKPLCNAQLNLYRMMMKEQGFDVERLFILQLKKDGTYKLQEFDFDDSVPRALLTLHNTLKKKRSKK